MSLFFQEEMIVHPELRPSYPNIGEASAWILAAQSGDVYVPVAAAPYSLANGAETADVVAMGS